MRCREDSDGGAREEWVRPTLTPDRDPPYTHSDLAQGPSNPTETSTDPHSPQRGSPPYTHSDPALLLRRAPNNPTETSTDPHSPQRGSPHIHTLNQHRAPRKSGSDPHSPQRETPHILTVTQHCCCAEPPITPQGPRQTHTHPRLGPLINLQCPRTETSHTPTLTLHRALPRDLHSPQTGTSP